MRGDSGHDRITASACSSNFGRPRKRTRKWPTTDVRPDKWLDCVCAWKIYRNSVRVLCVVEQLLLLVDLETLWVCVCVCEMCVPNWYVSDHIFACESIEVNSIWPYIEWMKSVRCVTVIFQMCTKFSVFGPNANPMSSSKFHRSFFLSCPSVSQNIRAESMLPIDGLATVTVWRFDGIPI